MKDLKRPSSISPTLELFQRRHRQSVQHWNCFKGAIVNQSNIGTFSKAPSSISPTLELFQKQTSQRPRWNARIMNFSERMDAHLNSTYTRRHPKSFRRKPQKTKLIDRILCPVFTGNPFETFSFIMGERTTTRKPRFAPDSIEQQDLTRKAASNKIFFRRLWLCIVKSPLDGLCNAISSKNGFRKGER